MINNNFIPSPIFACIFFFFLQYFAIVSKREITWPWVEKISDLNLVYKLNLKEAKLGKPIKKLIGL